MESELQRANKHIAELTREDPQKDAYIRVLNDKVVSVNTSLKKCEATVKQREAMMQYMLISFLGVLVALFLMK